jgi:hypothetical protein
LTFVTSLAGVAPHTHPPIIPGPPVVRQLAKRSGTRISLRMALF